MSAILLYDTPQNEQGLISDVRANGQNSDFPPENFIDYSTYTRSISTTNTSGDVRWFFELTREVPINCIAIAGHTIPAGSEVWLQDDSVPVTLEKLADVTPHVGPWLLKTSTTYNLQDFSVRIRPPGPQAQGVPFYISSLFMGLALDLPNGITAPYQSPPEGREATLYPNVGAKGGQFLGSHVERVGWRFNITQQNVDPNWVRVFWRPAVKHLEHRPFFFSWDQIRAPEDCMYGWTDGPVAPPRYTNPRYQAINVRCRGMHVL